ncbi:MAG TPA: thioredoxin domain-containing protein [Rhizomicrobium sp.]|nr:thioredoxin domain-containing protein [Rhizomicrobium sp.]
MKNRNWALAIVVLLLLLGGSAWYLMRDGQSPASIVTGDASRDTGVASDERHIFGNPKAPVTVIEYAALTCPHCAEFNEHVMPTLKSKYIDTGKVFYVFRVLPISPADFKAEGLAVCQSKERYLETVDTLYRRQNEWGPMQMEEHVPDMNAQPKTDAGLMKIGSDMGLDAEKARSCMHDYTLHQAVEKVASEGALRYGITSVPSLIVNGKAMDAPHTAEELDKLLTPLLEGK